MATMAELNRKLDEVMNHPFMKRLDRYAAERTAKRDGEDPRSAPQTRQYETADMHLASERSELRTGALSKRDSADSLQKLHNLAQNLPKQLRTSEDVAEFGAVQARYDSVFQELGKYGHGPGFAAAPRESEGLMAYRYNLADSVKRYSPKFRDIGLTGLGISAFRVMEPQIIADALQEAEHPTEFGPNELREMERFDETGRKYLEYVGHPRAWMDQFAVGTRKRLIGIRTANQVGYIPNS